jgi:hypothetical protein
LVTSVLSIQKPSTYTRWIGRESVVACMPTSFASTPVGSAAHIENSPPGIHTIESGAGPGGVDVLAAVGGKVVVVVFGSAAAVGT